MSMSARERFVNASVGLLEDANELSLSVTELLERAEFLATFAGLPDPLPTRALLLGPMRKGRS